MKIIVSEACDGFSIILNFDNGTSRRYWFDQEEDKTSLVEVFKTLGFQTEYEEDY